MAIDLSRDIVLRWEDQDPALAPLLRDGGIDVVLTREPAAPFKEACQTAGIRVMRAAEVAISDFAGFRGSGPAPAALAEGLWPGIGKEISMESEAEEIASASRQPWIDANGFRYAWLKALCPSKHPVLAYQPDKAAGLVPERIVPFDTLELALAEAWLNGGNYILAVEPRYRAALLRRDPKAVAAWKNLGRTARWLKENKALFGHPVVPCMTALVEAGEATAELANLLYRQNASPDLAPADAPPPPDPARRNLIVAASLTAPRPEARKRILAHASGGAVVVVDREEGEPWWRVPELKLQRDEADRETFQFGRGKVVAYKQIISDPNDFALDAIDLLTHPKRAVRTWWMNIVIATLTAGPSAGPHRSRALLHTINYGHPFDYDFMVYAQGQYDSALLLRPEAEPLRLKTARRGSCTELILPELNRVAVTVLI